MIVTLPYVRGFFCQSTIRARGHVMLGKYIYIGSAFEFFNLLDFNTVFSLHNVLLINFVSNSQIKSS